MPIKKFKNGLIDNFKEFSLVMMRIINLIAILILLKGTFNLNPKISGLF